MQPPARNPRRWHRRPMAVLVFWLSALCLAHTYFLYPLILVLWDALAQSRSDLAYLGRGRDRRRAQAPLQVPKVTLAVAAWNEASVIGQKLENSLSLDYPEDRLEVLVGSDGSDDGTDEIVLACKDPRVRLSSAPRVGKVGVLNRIVPQAKGDILVFSDANTVFDPSAIRKLVRHFVDPSIGLVCGRLRLYNPGRSGYEESAYWRYESFLKFHEGKRGAVMGANGGIYALRKSLFETLPGDTVVEDFVVAGRCLLRGHRVIYDPEAVAWEETTEDYGKERVRRARIAAGNFQSLSLLGGLMHPRHGFVAFAFISHKLLRWLAPFFLLTLFVSNLFLVSSRMYFAAMLGQWVFYALAFLGFRGLARRGEVGRAASLARYFAEMNWGMAQGFFRWLKGTQKVTWDRTTRSVRPRQETGSNP